MNLLIMGLPGAGKGTQAHAEVQKHSSPRAGHGHLVRKPRSEPSAV